VPFGKAKYSHNALIAVNNEIVAAYLGSDAQIYDVSVGWNTTDGMVSGFGESGKESRVVLYVDDAAAAEYANRFYEFYGDMVVVKAGEAYVFADDSALASAPSAKNARHLLFVTMFVLISGSILFIYRNRLIPALQINNGGVAEANAPISRKQTVDAVKNSAVTPSDEICKGGFLNKFSKSVESR